MSPGEPLFMAILGIQTLAAIGTLQLLLVVQLFARIRQQWREHDRLARKRRREDELAYQRATDAYLQEADQRARALAEREQRLDDRESFLEGKAKFLEAKFLERFGPPLQPALMLDRRRPGLGDRLLAWFDRAAARWERRER